MHRPSVWLLAGDLQHHSLGAQDDHYLIRFLLRDRLRVHQLGILRGELDEIQEQADKNVPAQAAAALRLPHLQGQRDNEEEPNIGKRQ